MAGKGQPKTGGRKPGSPNKTTASVKEAIRQCFQELGGVKHMLVWAKKNPEGFYNLYGRLVPHEVSGPDGEPLRIVVEQLDQDNGE